MHLRFIKQPRRRSALYEVLKNSQEVYVMELHFNICLNTIKEESPFLSRNKDMKRQS